MDHRERSLFDVLRIEDADIIPEDIEMIQQRDNVAVSLSCRIRSRDESWFLEGRTGSGPERLGDRLIPGEVAQAVEQSARRGAALFKIVRLGAINHRLPVVVVLHGHEAIVYPREFARVCVHLFCWLHPTVWTCHFRIKYPACRLVPYFISPSHGSSRCIDRRKEKEDIAIGDREVEDDFAVRGLVAAYGMALKGCVNRISESSR